MHADRTNRAALVLFALLLIAAGVAGALAGFGTFGSDIQHGPLVSDQVSSYFGRHGDWLWPVIAAAALVLALLSLRWLRTLLLSTDRAGDLPLTGDQSAGRTTLVPGALSDAVSGEIGGYPGVQSVRARVIGDPQAPTLVIAATLAESADLPAVRRRIEAHAVRHARQALDDPELPVRLDLTVSTRPDQRVS